MTSLAARSEEVTLNKKRSLRTFWGNAITAIQVSIDFFTVVGCFYFSYWFYTEYLSGLSPLSFSGYTLFTTLCGVLYIIVLDRVGLYKREISLLNVKELRGIFYVGLYAAALILSLSFYIRVTSFSRVNVTLALILTPVALYVQRQLFYKVHVLFHQKGWSQKKVLIYGAGAVGLHLAKRLFESPSLGMFPIGFLDDDAQKTGSVLKWIGGPKTGVTVLGGEEKLDTSMLQNGVESVFIALPSAHFERNQKLVERCNSLGVDYAVVPNSYETFVEQIEFFELGGIPLMRKRKRRASLFYIFAKRIFDLVLSTFFILLLSPLILLFGILIKLDSPGPVLFKQKRVGLFGREFSCYKFRSMRIDAPAYARTPSDPHDPRITKVGRWIRRTSLDELPQLFNVFRGDMSLVGPRPEMPFIVQQYSELQRKRLDVKPGITGVWQISAFRGEPIHQNIEYDLFYIENQSMLLDIAILLKTIFSVVRGIGAI
jgi:exopolysaccharide biosynthesis polyprenyl glycosylphosphotransferase